MRYNEIKERIQKLKDRGFYKFKGWNAYFYQITTGSYHSRFTITAEEIALFNGDFDTLIDMEIEELRYKHGKYLTENGVIWNGY